MRPAPQPGPLGRGAGPEGHLGEEGEPPRGVHQADEGLQVPALELHGPPPEARTAHGEDLVPEAVPFGEDPGVLEGNLQRMDRLPLKEGVARGHVGPEGLGKKGFGSKAWVPFLRAHKPCVQASFL